MLDSLLIYIMFHAKLNIYTDKEDTQAGEPPALSKGIMSMLENIRHKFEVANDRITALDESLRKEVCDPTLREWEYSKESLVCLLSS